MPRVFIFSFNICIFYVDLVIDSFLLLVAGMPSMIGLPSDRALVQDDECLRFVISEKTLKLPLVNSIYSCFI